jgi:hypothetical protein
LKAKYRYDQISAVGGMQPIIVKMMAIQPPIAAAIPNVGNEKATEAQSIGFTALLVLTA